MVYFKLWEEAKTAWSHIKQIWSIFQVLQMQSGQQLGLSGVHAKAELPYKMWTDIFCRN